MCPLREVRSRPFTRLDRARFENSHRWPQFLPDGRTVIFLARASAIDKQGVFTATLGGGERKLLFRTPYAAIYAPGNRGGSILFADGDVLMSRPFDPRRFSSRARLCRSPISSESSPTGPTCRLPTMARWYIKLENVQQERLPGTTATENPWELLVKNASEPYLRVSPDDRYALTSRVDRRVGSGDIWIRRSAAWNRD